MSTEQATSRRRWFGRRELLLLVAIAGLALAAIVPAMLRAREAERRTRCQDNLMRTGLGIQNFHDIRREICPSYLTDDHSPAALPCGFATWAVLLLPFTEQQGVYFGFDVTVPLDETPRTPFDQRERRVLDSYINNYRCPSRGRDVNSIVLGDYACVSLAEAVPGRVLRAQPRTWDAAMLPSRAFNASGAPNTESLGGFAPGTVGPREYRSMTTFKSITDGLSNTVFVGEKAVRYGHIGGQRIDFAQVVLADEQDGPLYYGRGGNPADLIAPGALSFWSRRLAPRPGEQLLPLDPQHEPPDNRFGSWHPGVTLFLFGDGSVRHANHATRSVVLQALGCRNDMPSLN